MDGGNHSSQIQTYQPLTQEEINQLDQKQAAERLQVMQSLLVDIDSKVKQ